MGNGASRIEKVREYECYLNGLSNSRVKVKLFKILRHSFVVVFVILIVSFFFSVSSL
jgi:hypothetical protein